MKRNISVLICLIICFVLMFTGCEFNFGDNKNEVSANTNRSSASQDNTEAKILFYFNNYYDVKPKESGDNEIIEQLQSNLRDNGINIRLIPYYSYSITLGRQSYIEAIKEMSAAGTIDAFHLPNNYAEQVKSESSFFQELRTIDLTDIFRTNAPILDKKLEQYGLLKSSEKISFIPMNFTGRLETGRNTVIMRDDVVEQLDIKNIRTFSEYEDALELIKSKTKYIPGNIYEAKYFDVMLQELNYYNLDGALNGNIKGSNTLGASLFAFKNDDKELVKPVPIEQIPGIFDQFTRLFDLHTKGLLKFLGTSPDPDFTGVASFIVPIGYTVSTFDYEKSKVFILNPEQPVKKAMSIAYDRIFILQSSKKSGEIVKMLEWINSKPENMQLIRYGKPGKDYRIDNNLVRPLVDGKNPENYEVRKESYDYRFRFQFLLDSPDSISMTSTGTSITYDKDKGTIGKVQDTLLPLEALIAANPDKDVKQIMNDVAAEYQQNGKDIIRMINNRTTDYYKALENIPIVDRFQLNVNPFDTMVKNQKKDEVKTIQDYYTEIIKRIKG